MQRLALLPVKAGYLFRSLSLLSNSALFFGTQLGPLQKTKQKNAVLC